jgi:hypothetical protein
VSVSVVCAVEYRRVRIGVVMASERTEAAKGHDGEGEDDERMRKEEAKRRREGEGGRRKDCPKAVYCASVCAIWLGLFPLHVSCVTCYPFMDRIVG